MEQITLLVLAFQRLMHMINNYKRENKTEFVVISCRFAMCYGVVSFTSDIIFLHPFTGTQWTRLKTDHWHCRCCGARTLQIWSQSECTALPANVVKSEFVHFLQPRVSRDPMNLFEERKSTFYWSNRYYEVHYTTD